MTCLGEVGIDSCSSGGLAILPMVAFQVRRKQNKDDFIVASITLSTEWKDKGMERQCDSPKDTRMVSAVAKGCFYEKRNESVQCEILLGYS